ncbi:hypothetical protein AX14_002763 [Amanita brunnescens Koide BX004]|nr:hypothetical protein AX14_002763 [Amanita brunnescens Koide BX004]
MTATVWDGRDGLELAVSSSFTSPFLTEAESGRTTRPTHEMKTVMVEKYMSLDLIKDFTVAMKHHLRGGCTMSTYIAIARRSVVIASSIYLGFLATREEIEQPFGYDNDPALSANHTGIARWKAEAVAADSSNADGEE